jgi:DNA-binding IscR family transcriptional regulator
MRRDSKVSDVLHVLLHMADQGQQMTSEQLAMMMSTNPVVVRRTLRGLREQGFVSASKGRSGGWSLTCDLKDVTLLQIYRAVGEPVLFAIGPRRDSSNCLVEKAVNDAMSDSIREAETLLLERFEATTLQMLYEDFSEGMEAVRNRMEQQRQEARR